MVNKEPTKCIENINVLAHWLLHVSALLMRHLQGFQYDPAELLPSVIKAE
jgi:hypothetical protein